MFIKSVTDASITGVCKCHLDCQLISFSQTCCLLEKSVLGTNSADHQTILLRVYIFTGWNFNLFPEKDYIRLKYV